jgi:hypothetical protein
MEFPLDLASRWGGKRYNSFNRVLKNTFNAIEYELEARNTWQGRLYTARLGVSRRADASPSGSQIANLKWQI